MYISSETIEQTEKRLKKVIQTADFRIFDKSYYFKEVPVANFEFETEALAIVKDQDVWSFLIPSVSTEYENFKVFSFHFENGLDNSGFVGWLASKIKEELGSGVFVVCGQNTNRGGIFDYWGCPIEIETEVISFIKKLRE
jgi:hypothetical protein